VTGEGKTGEALHKPAPDVVITVELFEGEKPRDGTFLSRERMDSSGEQAVERSVWEIRRRTTQVPSGTVVGVEAPLLGWSEDHEEAEAQEGQVEHQALTVTW